MDLALIVLRLTVGLLLVGHGAQKLFGRFGGHGLQGTAQFSLHRLLGTALPPNASFVGVGLVIAGWVFALIVSTRTAIDSSTVDA